MRPEKLRPLFTAVWYDKDQQYGTIKILPCSKTLNAEHRPKFAALHW
jgi:hypothetical protein